MKTQFLAAVLIAGMSFSQAVLAADAHPYYRQPGAQRGPAKAQSPRAASGTEVVNAASYEPGVSPGGLATIFGTDLTSVSGTVIAGTNPWPTTLGNVNVTVNGVYAPIFSVAYANGEDQISFQVPYDAAVGPQSAHIRVFDQGFETANFYADSFSEDPGIFMYQGQYAVALNGTDYSLIGPDNPIFPGEYAVLYTTGLGPVSLHLSDGYGAPSSPLAYTMDPFQVMLDGEVCTVYFSGLAPGFAGLYQVNFQVPRDARFGNLQLKIQSPFADSTSVTLPVD
jgi:uncharacterized protein (TIGR03437 family)